MSYNDAFNRNPLPISNWGPGAPHQPQQTGPTNQPHQTGTTVNVFLGQQNIHQSFNVQPNHPPHALLHNAQVQQLYQRGPDLNAAYPHAPISQPQTPQPGMVPGYLPPSGPQYPAPAMLHNATEISNTLNRYTELKTQLQTSMANQQPIPLNRVTDFRDTARQTMLALLMKFEILSQKQEQSAARYLQGAQKLFGEAESLLSTLQFDNPNVNTDVFDLLKGNHGPEQDAVSTARYNHKLDDYEAQLERITGGSAISPDQLTAFRAAARQALLVVVEEYRAHVGRQDYQNAKVYFQDAGRMLSKAEEVLSNLQSDNPNVHATFNLMEGASLPEQSAVNALGTPQSIVRSTHLGNPIGQQYAARSNRPTTTTTTTTADDPMPPDVASSLKRARESMESTVTRQQPHKKQNTLQAAGTQLQQQVAWGNIRETDTGVEQDSAHLLPAVTQLVVPPTSTATLPANFSWALPPKSKQYVPTADYINEWSEYFNVPSFYSNPKPRDVRGAEAIAEEINQLLEVGKALDDKKVARYFYLVKDHHFNNLPDVITTANKVVNYYAAKKEDPLRELRIKHVLFYLIRLCGTKVDAVYRAERRKDRTQATSFLNKMKSTLATWLKGLSGETPTYLTEIAEANNKGSQSLLYWHLARAGMTALFIRHRYVVD
jgi:hypothetical protein